MISTTLQLSHSPFYIKFTSLASLISSRQTAHPTKSLYLSCSLFHVTCRSESNFIIHFAILCRVSPSKYLNSISPLILDRYISRSPSFLNIQKYILNYYRYNFLYNLNSWNFNPRQCYFLNFFYIGD